MLDRETAEKLREMGLLGRAQILSAQERDPEADSLAVDERFGLSWTPNEPAGGTAAWYGCSVKPGSACQPASRILASGRSAV